MITLRPQQGRNVCGGNVIAETIAKLEAVLYWLGSGVVVAFIGLVVIAPERVDRTMMDILTRIVTAVVAVVSGN